MFVIRLIYQRKIYLIGLSAKVNVSQLCSWESLFFNMFWKSSAAPKTNLYFASSIGRSTSSFADKMMKGITSSSFSTICYFMLLLSGCCCAELIYQPIVHRLKKLNNNLFLLISAKKHVEISLNGMSKRSVTNHGMWQRWQLLHTAMHAWTQARFLRWWHFSRLSTNGNFPFLEKRVIRFFSRDESLFTPSRRIALLFAVTRRPRRPPSPPQRLQAILRVRRIRWLT